MMKKSLGLALLLMMVMGVFPQQPSIIESVLTKSVEEKITYMQELIGFDDGKAQQLKQIELSYLLDVNKAERCFLCNKNKRIKKLKYKHDMELQKILERDEYIKYEAIENDRIKKHPLWTN
ncbi:MAG: hypothetical protein WBJ13_05085 [Sedimentibacter sp.]